MLKPEEIEYICDVLEEEIKDTNSELSYNSEYEFLVAVVLSAQTTDRQVNIVTKKLFSVVKSPQEMIDLGYDKICEYIDTVSFFQNKAKYLIDLSKRIIDVFGGKVPQNREDLMSLPGVGRKTANVVLNQLFDKPTIAVDTHVHRVSNRLGLSCQKNPDKIEADLCRIIPEKYMDHIGSRILLFGRYTCTARSPKCYKCKFKHICKEKRS